MIGSKFWSSSCVFLKSGEVFYLKDTYEELEEKMRSKKAEIEVTTSNLFGRKKYSIPKEEIAAYGGA